MQPPIENDPATGHLSVATVKRLEAVLGGDARTEAMIVKFMKDRYEARNLFFLSPKVADQILRRPVDFIRAAKQHCEPELGV